MWKCEHNLGLRCFHSSSENQIWCFDLIFIIYKGNFESKIYPVDYVGETNDEFISHGFQIFPSVKIDGFLLALNFL